MRDLRGQQQGMLVAVTADAAEQIIGTVHAIFDLAQQNPNGEPYAWISNLTVAPAWRGRGLGHALLAAGLMHLQRQGAHSVALSVDGNDDGPLALYHSAGFQAVTTV